MVREILGKNACDLQLQNEIRLMKETEKPIVLFGAGCTSEFIVDQMHEMGIYPEYFCDNDNGKVGKRIAGLKVLSADCLQKIQDCYIYITTQLYYKEIKEQLVCLGICENRILQCDIIYQFPWEKQIIPYLEDNEDVLDRFYDGLQDAKSKLVFENRLKFLITRKREYMIRIHDNVQYFDETVFNSARIKNYIDIGAYTGDTIAQFCKLNNIYEHIWGFEPDRELYKTAKRNLRGCKGVTIVPCATSDFDGTTLVESGLGKMQTIDNQYSRDSSSGQTFEVLKLDTYFANRDINTCFVKMDIEGAELATLKGMRRFIERNTPILAICVYHKLEDIVEIPRLLDSLNLSGGGV